MVLVCHVITEDHELKGSCDFMGDSPSTETTILSSVVAINTLLAEI